MNRTRTKNGEGGGERESLSVCARARYKKRLASLTLRQLRRGKLDKELAVVALLFEQLLEVVLAINPALHGRIVRWADGTSSL